MGLQKAKQGLDRPVRLEAGEPFPSPEKGQGKGDGHEVEGQRQHMGMEIPEQEAELREFVDDLLVLALRRVIPHHPGGPPPDPGPLQRGPACRPWTSRRRRVQLRDVQPGPEPGVPDPAARMGQIQDRLPVPRQAHPEGREEGNRPRHPRSARPIERPQIPPHAGGRQQRQGEPGGDPEVERDAGRQAGELGEKPQEDVAEVVIADGEA
jgi:hypothetical protein